MLWQCCCGAVAPLFIMFCMNSPEGHSEILNKDWKIGIENCKYAPVGEDMFAEMCMKNGVTGTEYSFILKIDFKLEEKDWKRGIENCKYGCRGEDISAEMCMKKNRVTGTEVFLEHVFWLHQWRQDQT